MSVARTARQGEDPRAPLEKGKQMSCDERVECRVTADEHTAYVQFAAEQGVSVSALMRKGMRAIMKQPEPVGEVGSIEIASLRRRMNALTQRVDELGRNDEEAEQVKADLRQAHHDAQRLLGRC